jgi:hypothetical protein
MPDYSTDRKWADKFLPTMKRAIADVLIQPAPDVEDMHRNTDLIVLRVESLRVACRVRRYSYFVRYPDEFTIRAGRPNGHETELSKLISGYGDYFLYGFANEDETDLHAWRIIDLRVFRLWYNRQLALNRGRLPGQRQENGDASSWFYAFNVSQLPKGALVGEFVPGFARAA